MAQVNNNVFIWELGSTSIRFETSGRGVKTISSGSGDLGGVSYGAYQLSSKIPRSHSPSGNAYND